MESMHVARSHLEDSCMANDLEGVNYVTRKQLSPGFMGQRRTEGGSSV